MTGAPYNITNLYSGNLFEMFVTLCVASNYVLLYVLYIVVFLTIVSIFAGRQSNTKNTLLLASVITTLFSIIMNVMLAFDGGFTAAVMAVFVSTTMGLIVISFGFGLYHVLSDL